MTENPYQSTPAQYELPAPGQPGDAPGESQPRVWTVFTVAGLGLVAALLGNIVASAILVGWQIAQGMRPEDVAENILPILANPGAFIILAAASQLAMAALTVLAAALSPQPLRQRLGIVSANMPAYGYPLLMVASLVPLAVGIGLAFAIAEVIPPDPSIEMMYEKMTLGWAIPFVLFIALGPGIVEELLFRGYIQRRLLERWRPWTAILVTSLIFAVYHVMPHPFALAFVMGIWLGLIAWRTGSALPGVCCHAFVNGIWNVWVIGIHLGAFPDMHETPLPVVVLATAVAMGSFFFALSMLYSNEPRLEIDFERFGSSNDFDGGPPT